MTRGPYSSFPAVAMAKCLVQPLLVLRDEAAMAALDEQQQQQGDVVPAQLDPALLREAAIARQFPTQSWSLV